MRALLALAFSLISTAAFAHGGHGEPAGLAHGFLHPLGGLDHILAMVAVGVFAFVIGGRALWLVPLTFVATMAIGFGLGLAGFHLPFVELMIAASSIVIGGAAALGRSMPLAAAASLVGAFALFHGHAHGAELPAGGVATLYAAGFIAATALLHGAGVAAALGGARLLRHHGRTAARLAGAGFALGGVGILAGWL
ncbi:MAG TPA: HupE/UreJ family protein [Devosiaceae bacterium]|jgi:urease accessory protein|nr:HupE/UreJ family protein [Devosiaceae bacterium]